MLFSLRMSWPRFWYEASLGSSESLSLGLRDGLLVGSEVNCSEVKLGHVVQGVESAVGEDEDFEVLTQFDGLFDFGSEFADFYFGEVELDEFGGVSFLVDGFLDEFEG